MSNEEPEEGYLDTNTEDCMEYFRAVLTEQFSGITFERYEVNNWRSGWRITVQPHLFDLEDGTLADFQEGVRALRDMLFWNKDVLVEFEIDVLGF